MRGHQAPAPGGAFQPDHVVVRDVVGGAQNGEAAVQGFQDGVTSIGPHDAVLGAKAGILGEQLADGSQVPVVGFDVVAGREVADGKAGFDFGKPGLEGLGAGGGKRGAVGQ